MIGYINILMTSNCARNNVSAAEKKGPRDGTDGKLAKGLARGGCATTDNSESGGIASGVAGRRRALVARRDDVSATVAVRAGLAGGGGLCIGILRLAGG